MSKLIKDLGAVSAYAYAVEKGYTGTEDEFAELMYDYTDVAQTAVEAKDEAMSASASAQASATTANTKADEASASASKAQSASDSAQGAETNAETFALNAGTKATEAKQFADKAELNAQKTQSDKEAVESAKSDVLSAVDNAQNYANSAQSASQAIQNMNVEATTLEPDSDAIVEKTVDATSGAVTLTYGIPKGQVGDKGDKGDTGDSGVYIGTSAPSDENVNVWIDSDGEPDDVIQIDDTLTQSGQAADAKVVGEKLTDLKSALSDVKEELSDEHISIRDIQEYLGRDIIYKGVYNHGSAVSFNTTKTAVNANQGNTVTVSINDTANPNANFFLYTKYAEDDDIYNAGRITSGGAITFTSEKTLEYVGVYLTNLESGTLTIMVTVNSNVDLISNINSKVDKDGIGQVTTTNLQDVKSNILFSQGQVSVEGTGNYVQTTILQYVDEFKVGDKFVILCDSVTGESVVSPSSPYAIDLYNEQGDEIRTRQYEDVEITASDINNGLSAIHFILYPAKGTKLPTGRATYTNVRVVKGTSETYELIGNLKQAVKNTFDIGTDIVPDYYHADDYLATKVARINALAEECGGNGDVFFFITDEHWDMEYNQKHAPALIGYLNNRCNIPRLFDGGDSANGTSIDFINALHSSYTHDIHHIMGNHDWMLNRSGDYLAYYFDSFGYNQVGNVEKHYYYVDNVQKKIRYIILNAWRSDLTQSNTLVSAYDAEQLNWFTGTALNVESGWDIIIFTHYIKDGSKYAPDGALAFANAIDNYEGNGNIICVFEGHTHWDNISHTNGGVPVIATTCDKNGSWISDGTNMEPWLDEQRPDGTIYEQAFDVVCLNRTTRKITMVRIGALAMDNVDKTFGESGFTTDGTLEEREIIY